MEQFSDDEEYQNILDTYYEETSQFDRMTLAELLEFKTRSRGKSKSTPSVTPPAEERYSKEVKTSADSPASKSSSTNAKKRTQAATKVPVKGGRPSVTTPNRLGSQSRASGRRNTTSQTIHLSDTDADDQSSFESAGLSDSSDSDTNPNKTSFSMKPVKEQPRKQKLLGIDDIFEAHQNVKIRPSTTRRVGRPPLKKGIAEVQPLSTPKSANIAPTPVGTEEFPSAQGGGIMLLESGSVSFDDISELTSTLDHMIVKEDNTIEEDLEQLRMADSDTHALLLSVVAADSNDN